MPVTFSYDPADPIVISMIIFMEADEEEPVRWSFSRELPKMGFWRSAGDGDVLFKGRWWSRALHITLRSEDGSNTFSIPRKGMRHFVRQTYRAVPRPREAEMIDEAFDRYQW
jgi:hypothetical protein